MYKVSVYRFRDNSDTNDREAGTYMEASNVASLLLVHSRESRINLKTQPSKKGGVSLLYAPGLARNLTLWEIEVKFKNWLKPVHSIIFSSWIKLLCVKKEKCSGELPPQSWVQLLLIQQGDITTSERWTGWKVPKTWVQVKACHLNRLSSCASDYAAGNCYIWELKAWYSSYIWNHFYFLYIIYH